MTPATLDLAVVIVNHSSAAKVLDLLQDLDASRPTIREAVIVDNGPEPFGTEPSGLLFATKVIRTQNRGFGTAVNEGVRHCRAAAVCISNPDVRLRQPGVLGLLHDALADQRVAIVAPRVLSPDGSEAADVPARLPSLGASISMAWRRLRHLPNLAPRGDVENVTGAFMVIRRSVWDELGGFDEGYFMYFEDADLCTKVRQAGLRIRVVHDAVIEHEVGGTPASWSQRRDWYKASRERYFARWRPWHEARVVQLLAAVMDRLRR